MPNNTTTKYSVNKMIKKRNNNIQDLNGKIPPQAVEVECAVLGALLIESHAYDIIANILSPNVFYKDAHQLIYTAIQSLASKLQTIDLLTVPDELRRTGHIEQAGGVYYISELTNSVASSANIEAHARILVQKHIQRELIRVSSFTMNEAYDDVCDPFELFANTEQSFDKIKSTVHGSTIISAAQVWERDKKNVLIPPERPLSVPSVLGIRHDFGTVDCFGAKPGAGKTATMIQGAVEASKEGYNVGVLSLELDTRLLVAKFQHHLTGVSSKKIIRSELNEYDKERLFNENQQVIMDILSRIFIDDTPCDRFNIRSKIVTLVKKYGCKVIWIDYIQLISLLSERGQTDVKAMELMQTTLQQTAKHLNISIIELSQLQRGEDRPSMEQLRGGGIEQACTKIFLIDDPNYKKNAGKAFLETEEAQRGFIEYINDKERFGDKTSIQAYFDKIAQTISHWDTRDLNKYRDKVNEARSKTPDGEDRVDLF